MLEHATSIFVNAGNTCETLKLSTSKIRYQTNKHIIYSNSNHHFPTLSYLNLAFHLFIPTGFLLTITFIHSILTSGTKFGHTEHLKKNRMVIC